MIKNFKRKLIMSLGTVLFALLIIIGGGLVPEISKHVSPESREKLLTIDIRNNHHVQGIAVDKKNDYIYYSFTDKIIKTDSVGNIIGSISGFVGHIGCIAFNENDGKIYASLEYKHDVIGQEIIENSDGATDFDDGFYIAVFDVGEIVEGNYDISDYPDMIKTVYLSEVLSDYKGFGQNKNGEKTAHKYGCSGIDGLCIAPLPGENKEDLYLYVAYGIYSDTNRDDNDHQIILCYNIKSFVGYARNFSQNSMHHSGPQSYDYKFFVYTGNTSYGVQNMSYDKNSAIILMSVYPGSKDNFDNYGTFAIDLTKKPEKAVVKGTDENGLFLSLKKRPLSDGTFADGWHSELGQCGMCFLDDGYYYLNRSIRNDGFYSAETILYKFDFINGFVPVE